MRLSQGLILATVFAGCVLPTDRTEGLGDGEIHGRAVRSDGKPASAALIALQGSSRVTTADADGAFAFLGLVPGRWLVRVTEDDDGDGAVERGAYVPVDLLRAAVPKNLTDGCAGAPANVVTSVLLGDVALEDTGSIIGTVTLDVDDPGSLGADERARVVVWRDVNGYATQLEASGGVDINGDYRIDGVIVGRVQVAAFVFDAVQGAVRPKIFAVDDVDVSAGEALIDLRAGEGANIEGGACAVDDDCLGVSACVDTTCVGPRLAATQIELHWTLPEPAAVDISQVLFTAPNGAPDLRDPDGEAFTLTESARAKVVDAPIGVVEILFTSATEGATDGLLRGAVIVPEGFVQGPVELPVLADACVDDNGTPDDPGDDARDCDGDGARGLPPPTGTDDAAWVACGACADAFGVAGAGARCGDFDCDDDGDGQPDVTEPARCLGPAIGTDLDADDLCEPAEDPFPLCAADDLAGCPAAFSPPPSRY
jgi:hypothetical protein